MNLRAGRCSPLELGDRMHWSRCVVDWRRGVQQQAAGSSRGLSRGHRALLPPRPGGRLEKSKRGSSTGFRSRELSPVSPATARWSRLRKGAVALPGWIPALEFQRCNSEATTIRAQNGEVAYEHSGRQRGQPAGEPIPAPRRWRGRGGHFGQGGSDVGPDSGGCLGAGGGASGPVPGHRPHASWRGTAGPGREVARGSPRGDSVGPRRASCGAKSHARTPSQDPRPSHWLTRLGRARASGSSLAPVTTRRFSNGTVVARPVTFV